MSEKLEIAVIETLDAKEVFTGKNPTLQSLISMVEAEVADFEGDITTASGRDEIKAVAYKVARSKTALDKLGKDFVAEIKAKTKSIDEQRKGMRETLEKLQFRVRQPLTEWEAEEERKKEALKQRLNDLEQMSRATITDIDKLEDGLNAANAEVIDDSWGPLKEMAQKCKDAAIEHLTTRIADLKKQEKEREELERFRAEAAEREKKEAEEREAKASKERRDQEERDAKAREDQIKADAEKRVQEAEKRAEEDKIAAVEAEKKRISDEKTRLEEEEAKRAANKKHNAKINNQALESLIAVGLSDDSAKKAVEAIARGQIPNVSIRY